MRISIHAAREGGDKRIFGLYGSPTWISIHAAREGGDIRAAFHIVNYQVFQSTPPVKAATAASGRGLAANLISIHAAREGGDIMRL